MIVTASEKYTRALVFPVKIIIPCHTTLVGKKIKGRMAQRTSPTQTLTQLLRRRFPQQNSHSSSAAWYVTLHEFNNILSIELSITSEYLNILRSACADRGLSLCFGAACSAPEHHCVRTLVYAVESPILMRTEVGPKTLSSSILLH